MKASEAPCRIGVDLLGGDDALPQQWLEAVLKAKFPQNTLLTLFGTKEVFRNRDRPPPHILFHAANEVIAMDDLPISSVRKKPNSSLCLGIKQLKSGHLDAFISAGNTGALLTASKFYLSMLPHVDRPALLTLLPTQKHEIAVIDVGANAVTRPKHLIQFALMGTAFQKTRGIEQPKVGLLNIGTEAKKGTPDLKKAYALLLRLQEEGTVRFAGNIEARDVFRGDIDVLVTDGFAGNVFLKTAEGIAAVILEELEHRDEIQQHGGLQHLVHALRQRLHYTEYPGALLCGTKGLVLKCHGNASAQSLLRSITSAERLVRHAFLQRVATQLEQN